MKKTNKAVLIASMLMAASVFFTAQKVNAQGSAGEIRGTIWEDSTMKVSIPGVNVYVTVGDNKIGSVTDENGKFIIKPLNSGTYNLTISSMGKRTTIKPVEVKPNMASFENDLVLADNTEDLPDLVIEVEQTDLINPEETSVKSISYKDIKNNPNLRNLNKLIQSTNSDYIVSENGKDAYVRGSRSDASVYFLDGVKMSTIGNVPGVSIGNVTIYTGGVPAKYGDTTSGVIIMETKSYFDMYNEWFYSQEND